MKWDVAVFGTVNFIFGAALVLIIQNISTGALEPPPLSHKEQCRSDLEEALRSIKHFADQYPKNDSAWESFLMVRHRKDVIKHLKKEGEYICHVLPPVIIKGGDIH